GRRRSRAAQARRDRGGAAARARARGRPRTVPARRRVRRRDRPGARKREPSVNPARRAGIFARLKALNPRPTTELEYRTPFELLVAVILSAQATDRSVNLATRELFRVANTPAAIAALGVEGLSEYVR